MKYEMQFCGMTKLHDHPIGGWLLIRVAANSIFHCTVFSVINYYQHNLFDRLIG